MTYRIEILRIAIVEMQEAYDWYELQIAGLGDQFIDEVDQYFNLIKQNPFQFAIDFSNQFRFATLKRFPYRVVYMVQEDRQTILINSVFHTSRDPGKW